MIRLHGINNHDKNKNANQLFIVCTTNLFIPSLLFVYKSSRNTKMSGVFVFFPLRVDRVPPME